MVAGTVDAKDGVAGICRSHFPDRDRRNFRRGRRLRFSSESGFDPRPHHVLFRGSGYASLLLSKIFGILIAMVSGIEQWDEKTLLEESKKTAKEHGLKLGQLLWPLRAALTGRSYSPGATEVAAILGNQETVERLKAIAV